MSIEVSPEIGIRITAEARRQGVSVDALLDRLMNESSSAAHVAETAPTPNVPILHLGAMGSLRRRDIYDDVR